MQAIISDPSMSLSWLLEPVDGSGDGELADSVAVALGTDRLADAADELPFMDDDDRRGFWGDNEAGLIFDGWPIGTRLWLLLRTVISGPTATLDSTLGRAETYVREALRPFIDRRIATRVDVRATREEIDRILIRAVMYRGPSVLVDLRYSALWTRIQERL